MSSYLEVHSVIFQSICSLEKSHSPLIFGAGLFILYVLHSFGFLCSVVLIVGWNNHQVLSLLIHVIFVSPRLFDPRWESRKPAKLILCSQHNLHFMSSRCRAPSMSAQNPGLMRCLWLGSSVFLWPNRVLNLAALAEETIPVSLCDDPTRPVRHGLNSLLGKEGFLKSLLFPMNWLFILKLCLFTE